MPNGRIALHAAIVLCCTTFCALLPGCSRKPAQGFEGYVEGKYVYVAAAQSGRLIQIEVTRGEKVDRGNPMFALEAEPEASAYRQAQDVLAADEARLADMQTGKRPPEVDVVRAQLAAAVADRDKSSAILRSFEAQFKAGGISETDLITARAAVEESAALVQQLKHSIAVAELPGRDDQLKAQEAILRADRASLAQAEWRLHQKEQSAPAAGLVVDTLYRVGEWVTATNPVIQLLPPGNVEIRFFVPEEQLGSFAVGQAVTVRCDGCAAPVQAIITYIANQAEYTPPVIYSNENRAKLVFMVIAKPSPEKALELHPGQPLEVSR